MITQTINNIFTAFSLLDLALFADDQQPAQFSASDIGYEISDDELIEGLSEPIPVILTGQPSLEASPDEFEAVYHWFVS
jgi:hypothetical protein